MLSLADGTNDVQKAMGGITLTLITAGTPHAGPRPPLWVILLAGLAIGLGTYFGVWRIIRTASDFGKLVAYCALLCLIANGTSAPSFGNVRYPMQLDAAPAPSAQLAVFVAAPYADHYNHAVTGPDPKQDCTDLLGQTRPAGDRRTPRPAANVARHCTVER